jgi:hypothetical protein
MANHRSGNWASQVRVDVPDVRALESAVRNDYDELLAALVLGDQNSLVIRGFEINMPGSIGNSANSLTMAVADSAFLHGASTTSGTFFVVRPGASAEVLNSTVNTNVVGSFAPNSNNYVALDLSRAVDDSTAAPRAVWDPVNQLEVSKVLPLAETANYVIKITTSNFAAGTLPICVVITDSANNVLDIQDSRPMLNRLGSAGFAAPNPAYVYPWNNQSEGRVENPPSSNNSNINPFHGGDKMIKTLKEWMDAVMSILKEIKGSTYWYSISSGGSLTSLREDAINTIITSAGTITHDATTAGKLNWSNDIELRVVSSRLTYAIQAYPTGNNTVLADNQVMYINLVRDQVITTPLVWTNGGPTVQSVGNVSWTTGLVAGDYIKQEGQDTSGYYKIQSVDSASQVTLTENFGGTSTGAGGISAEYSYGVYTTAASPTTNRNVFIANRQSVPVTQDMFWLAFRDDNASTPRIYTRFKAGEIEQGESIIIDGNVPQEILTFMGAVDENDSTPPYTIATLPSQTYQITPADSLTSAISKLIGNQNTTSTALDNPSYQETIEIVASSPGSGESLPVSSGSTISLPNNSRLSGDPQQNYTVGKGALEIYLNGTLLIQDKANGWSEVGTSGNDSTLIIIDQDLVVGDELTFRIDATGGPGAGGSGGGGGSTDQYMNDPTLSTASLNNYLPVYDVAGTQYSKQLASVFLSLSKDKKIVHITSSYTASDGDDFLVADLTAANLTITLPSATGSGRDGVEFKVKRIDGTANTLTIVDAAGNKLDAATSYTGLGQYDTLTFTKDLVKGQYWIS